MCSELGYLIFNTGTDALYVHQSMKWACATRQMTANAKYILWKSPHQPSHHFRMGIDVIPQPFTGLAGCNKTSRIENTLAHDLPFRENDSLVFIWLVLNRQMTVAVMVRESERDLWKNKRQSCSSLAWFHKDWWDGKRVGRAAGSNGSFRAQWSAALHWLVFWHRHSPGPYRSSWNLNHHLWLLAPLGKRGWLIWMDWCQQAFYVSLHAGRGRLRQITGDLVQTA